MLNTIEQEFWIAWAQMVDAQVVEEPDESTDADEQ